MTALAAVQQFFFKKKKKPYFSKCVTFRLIPLQEMPTLQHVRPAIKQEYQDLHNSSVAVVSREMQREVNTGRPFESRLHFYCFTNNHLSQLRSASDLGCCFMATLSWRKLVGPRIVRKLWSNSRERTQGNEKDACSTSHGVDSSYTKGIEVLLRETARMGYPDPEDVDNPKIAPQDESWSSKTEIFGYDQQIYPGTSPFS